MKINLRRSSVLQTTIRDAIIEQDKLVSGELKMPLWNASDENISRARGEQMTAFNAVERLEEILQTIRDQTGKANVKGKIASLLAEQPRVQAQIKRLERMVKCEIVPSSAEFEKKVASLNQQNEKSSYSVNSSVAVGIFSSADIAKFKNQLITLRRRQVEINDELIAANLSTEINISDNDWNWLEAQGIV